jgi:hypothetical protein
MQKDANGYTQVKRTVDILAIRELVDEGIPLGSLWYSNHFGEKVGQ